MSYAIITATGKGLTRYLSSYNFIAGPKWVSYIAQAQVDNLETMNNILYQVRQHPKMDNVDMVCDILTVQYGQPASTTRERLMKVPELDLAAIKRLLVHGDTTGFTVTGGRVDTAYHYSISTVNNEPTLEVCIPGSITGDAVDMITSENTYGCKTYKHETLPGMGIASLVKLTFTL